MLVHVHAYGLITLQRFICHICAYNRSLRVLVFMSSNGRRIIAAQFYDAGIRAGLSNSFILEYSLEYFIE